MVVSGHIEEKVEVPKGVQITLKGTDMTVKGPNGTLTRSFDHTNVKVAAAGDHVTVSCEMPRTRDKAVVGTFAAHIRNMIGGVTHGYAYDMKIVYSHFPIKAAAKGDKFLIENFLGEKAPRSAVILKDVKVAVKGNEVEVTGADLEAVSQTAANIERATKIKGFDPRVFQDGIYITEKARRAK
ncbi:MAG: 50S ribosomal protein L6 [Methanomassiliicoccales archaeon PtaU1.Bin124]|nr:MAG: 50S ribosomal protein L6 [Methanomassiliicoccales archaeon PtaU1.Bin124]